MKIPFLSPKVTKKVFSAHGCLKDMLKQLWTYKYKACACKFLDKWIDLAKETEIAKLEEFAKGLEPSTKPAATMTLITRILKVRQEAQK